MKMRRATSAPIVLLALGLCLPAAAQNNPPTSVVTDGAGNTINDGDGRAMNEGDAFTLDIQTSDPDGDLLTVTVVFRDASGNDTGEGNYDPGTGSWVWTAGQGSGGSYTVTVEVCDAEFCVTTTLNLSVWGGGWNFTTPVQVAPADGVMVGTFTPTLVVDNAIDPDPDPITYDFQLYYSANPGPTPAMSPDQEVTDLPEGSGGQTTWMTAPIPENFMVFWRVRAWDGYGPNSYTPWSDFHSFFVNTMNDPPVAPVLTKPAEGEIMATRTPLLESNNTTDPERDPIDLYFEVATDDTFTTIVQASSRVPQTTAGTFTSWWDPAVRLDWGTIYAARVYAVDANGAVSSFSNLNHFRTMDAPRPPDISLQAPFSSSLCTDVVLDGCPDSIRVSNAVDPEANPITIDLEIYEFADTPGVDLPVIQVLDFPQDLAGSGTDVPIDCSLLAENGHYRVRAQASDGEWVSNYGLWAECDMWIDASNCDPNGTNCGPGAITILSPTAGAVFPADTTTVTVTVLNARDSESALPGHSLSIALCASTHATFGDCPALPSSWSQHPAIADPTTTTEIQLGELLDGTPLGPALQVHLQACALDEKDECGPSDTTSFSIEALPPTCEDIQCSTDEICDPATVTCVTAPTPDGGPADAGDPGAFDSGDSLDGCCKGESATGGSAGPALAAILGVFFLCGRRRYGR